MSKISIDTEFEGHVFMGASEGTFKTELGDMMPYCNIYVISPAPVYRSGHNRAFGFAAEKFKCVSAALYKDIQLGAQIKLYFDQRGKVCLIEKVAEKSVEAGKSADRDPF